MEILANGLLATLQQPIRCLIQVGSALLVFLTQIGAVVAPRADGTEIPWPSVARQQVFGVTSIPAISVTTALTQMLPVPNGVALMIRLLEEQGLAVRMANTTCPANKDPCLKIT